jgi:hypothetical protein
VASSHILIGLILDPHINDDWRTGREFSTSQFQFSLNAIVLPHSSDGRHNVPMSSILQWNFSSGGIRRMLRNGNRTHTEQHNCQ